MRVAIAGAGVVGRSIAQALLDTGHKVLIIERERPNYRPHLVRGADWMLGDACELRKLQDAGIETCDVVLAATGDDKANLVFAFLAKTEFGVPRVMARVNDTSNQWLFNEMWGVDVAVSTPISLANAVKADVTVGELVQLMVLQQGHGDIMAIKLPAGTALVGTPVDAVPLPAGAALLTVVRGGMVLPRKPGTLLEADDELLLAAGPNVTSKVRALVDVKRPNQG
jgi:trk system potassium uptake protein TrkA